MKCQNCGREIEETVFFPIRCTEEDIKTLCEECYILSVPITSTKPNAKACLNLLEEVIIAPVHIQTIMRNNGLAFTDLNDPMQKLGFTIYSCLSELAMKAENVLNEE